MANTLECLYASVKVFLCTVGGNSVALKDMKKLGSFKVSGMLHGRIKWMHRIHILYTYKCTVYTTIIHMYRICYIILCICTYCKYTVGPVVKPTSTQRPPVLSDSNWTIHYVNSSTVNHLCIKTTCLESPPFTAA